MVKVICWELNKVFDTITCNIFLSKPGKCGQAERATQDKALHGLACAKAVPCLPSQHTQCWPVWMAMRRQEMKGLEKTKAAFSQSPS